MRVRLVAMSVLVALGALGASCERPLSWQATGPARPASTIQTAGIAGVPNGAPLPDLGRAPELAGIDAWINSEPLTMAALRGKVVLVDFWTFACGNCIRTLPHVKGWHRRYSGDGLVVIGVHTPELPHERVRANVEAAVRENGIEYPVAIDGSFATWKAYHNRYWPAFYFVDSEGRVRHTQFGEGSYDRSEAVIRALLAETRAGDPLSPPESESRPAGSAELRRALGLEGGDRLAVLGRGDRALE